MPTLFDIGEELRALNELLEERDGDVSDPAVEQAIDQWFTEFVGAESAKADAYVGYIRTLEGEIAVANAEIEQFRMKAQSRAKRVTWLKDRLKLYMELTGKTKIPTAAGRVVAIQSNGGNQPIKLNLLPHELPAEFLRVTVEPDLDKIRESLLAGGEATKFATLEPRGSHIRIR